jgi:predicted extracellular nuclease
MVKQTLLSYRPKIRLKIRLLFFWLLIFHIAPVFSQQLGKVSEPPKSLRIMFYNCENFFDTYNDSLTSDEEFLPGGERHWTNNRFYKKLQNTFKVIMAVGGGETPAIVGLSEIENRFVLEKLVFDTPLKNFVYRIIHHESPDRRGIDVGLLYRKSCFTPLHDEAIRIPFADDTASRTRDILYAKGLLENGDTLHVFVNHWPSRYGGYMPTLGKRNFVAGVLKKRTDSLFLKNPEALIVIMGDFNDDPADESISRVLKAGDPVNKSAVNQLYDLMLVKPEDWPFGTLKYRESWNTFDQLIVSEELLDDSSSVHLSGRGAHIFHDAFLLEPDDAFLGQRPFRTYNGFKYSGGFSDHLPVYIDLIFK